MMHNEQSIQDIITNGTWSNVKTKLWYKEQLNLRDDPMTMEVTYYIHLLISDDMGGFLKVIS